ncbi:MAG: MFS transporter [Opitutaceae bacterium]
MSAPSPIPVKRSEIFGWCCFDFANSAFTTIIITVVYAVYFKDAVALDDPAASSWWGRALAISQMIVILVAPWLGAVADFTARKKRYLMISATTCSLATAMLFFTGAGDVKFALILVVLANVAFSVSENLCASFLPEISTPENVGRISGYGWSFGYMGGLLSLGLALAIIMGLHASPRWTFVMTGAFFLLASLPTQLLLRERSVPKPLPPGQSYVTVGWGAIASTLRELPKHRTLAVFFIAFTCFLSGLMAIITFASLFGTEVLHLTTQENIGLFAALQITSALGAFGFGYFQDRVGAKPTLVIALLLWVGVCGWAAFCQSKTEFFIIGALAGFGIGSLQSSSRAVVAALTPPGRAGEFFGFWGLFGKLGGVIGPLTMGELATHLGYRTAVLINGGFFVAGLLILLGLSLPKARGQVSGVA